CSAGILWPSSSMDTKAQCPCSRAMSLLASILGSSAPISKPARANANKRSFISGLLSVQGRKIRGNGSYDWRIEDGGSRIEDKEVLRRPFSILDPLSSILLLACLS